MEERKENLEEVKQKAKEVMEKIDVEKVLDNNSVEFEYKGTTYKVRKPTYKEREEVNLKRAEKHSYLLTAKNEDGSFKYLSEKDLIKIYRDRGIDIEGLDKKIDLLRQREKDYLLKLGKGLKEKSNEAGLDSYRKEIESLRERINEIVLEKTNLMSCSIEQQVLLFAYSYFSYLITEKKVDGKFVKAWNTYEDYLNEEEDLTNLVTSYVSLLLLSGIE